jgi:hypothetical protein
MATCRAEKTHTAFIVLASLLIFLFSPDARSQTSDQSMTIRYLKFFLDVPPTDTDRAKLPSDAHDVIIAKVRNLEQPPSYQLGRDRDLSSPLPKDLFFTRIQIVDVLSGRAQAGTQYDVHFGVLGLAGPQHIYPHTPRQNAREYFVVSYIGADDKRRLLPFPANEQEYNSWSQEVSEHERVRSRPGHRDQR